MPNMDWVHGVEEAIRTIREEIKFNSDLMTEWRKMFDDTAKENIDIDSFHMLMEEAKNYHELNEENRKMRYIVNLLKEKIDNEMSKEADAV